MIKLTFVGDIFPANMLYRNHAGLATQYIEHRGTVWSEALRSMFESEDFIGGNLESPVCSDEARSSGEIFLGCHDFLRFLRESGFSVLNIANNYILEHGIDGFRDTIEAIRKNGMKVFGYEQDGTSNISILEKDGTRIGFAGFNAIHDILMPNSYAVMNLENILAALQKMPDCDFRVISLHWGSEYLPYPSPEQVQFAHKIIDAGADAVIGHHAHHIQPVERYRNGVIFYNLGNFLFDGYWSKAVNLGMIARLRFIKGRPVEYSAEPVYRSKDNRFIPFAQERFQRKLDRARNKTTTSSSYRRKVKLINRISRVKMFAYRLAAIPGMSPEAKKYMIHRFKTRILKK